MDSKYKKLKTNTLLMLISNFSSKVLVFLLIPLYTHCLSTKEYGISDIIFTTVNLLYPIFTLLMTEAILRFTLDNNTKSENDSIFSIAIFISFIGFIILLLVGPLIANLLHIGNYIIYFYLYYLSTIVYFLFSQFTKGMGKVKEFAISGLINTIVTIICNVFMLVFFNLKISGYILSYVIGMLVASIYLFFKVNLRSYFINIKRIDRKKTKEMLLYSIPMIPNSISWWISNSSDKYILSIFKDLSETGIYSASYKIPTLLTTFSNVFVGSWQLSSVDEFGSEESIDFHKKVYLKYSTIVTVSVVWLIFLSKLISKFLFSAEYYSAWEPAIILLFAFLFNTLSGFLGTIYTSAKKTFYLFLSTLIAAILNIICNIIFIPKFGMVGAAFATLISYFFVWVFRIINTRKILNMHLSLTNDFIAYLFIITEIALMLLDYNMIFVFLIPVIITILNRKNIKIFFLSILNKK